jgi:hypothetical protein
VKGAAGADAAIGRILPGLMLAVVAGVAVGAALSAPPAMAAPIENRTAVFAGLDKITGEITTFSVPINETKPFGSLSVTPRTCHTRPVTEEPRTMAFVEVDERLVNGGSRRIFTGWMNAESPGLNAVEHPIFDVWLTGCRDPLPEKAQDGQARRGAVPLRPEKTGLKKAPGG